MFDHQTESQLVPDFLLLVSVRELHNRLLSDPNDDGLKYTRDEGDNILIIDYTLCSLFPPELKQISARYKVMWGFEFLFSAKSIHP